jgi:nucleotide-binding universal stress UspA family protein
LESQHDRESYLNKVAERLKEMGVTANQVTSTGDVAEKINSIACGEQFDLIAMSTHARTGLDRWLASGVTNKIIQNATTPILILRPTGEWRSRWAQFKKLLVPLDGSEFSELALPYAKAIARKFGSEIILLSVPTGLEDEGFSSSIRSYLETISAQLQSEGFTSQAIVTGTGPARTIVEVSQTEMTDVVLIATHGHSSVDQLMIGSVADRVVRQTTVPIFLVPVREC